MLNSELHNFIPDYKCQNNEDIQWETARRYEFNELSSKSDRAQKKGRFFYHQELFLRYLRQYDKIFNIQGTGTGKSGSIINVAEYYKSRDEGIKRVFVLQPGPPTVKDFKNQIIKLSDPKEYTSVKLRAATTSRSRKNNLSRLISEWYSVTTYQQFAKIKYNNDDIKEYFSDSIIFMDEAHKLRNLEDSGGGEMSEEEKNNIYQFLWRVTHIAERSKIIISSATPMINDTSDFALLANLLLPEENQLPINVSDTFYDRVTLSQLEPFLRGKITFIKFLESNINIINPGTVLDKYYHNILMPKNSNEKGEPLIPLKRKLNNNEIIDYEIPNENNQPLVESNYKRYVSQVGIYLLEMKGIQLEKYIENLNNTSKFFSDQRQCSVFVFPNGQHGSEGFKTFVEKDSNGNYIFKEKIIYKDDRNKLKNIPPMKAYINTSTEEKTKQSLENLDQFSCKFKFFIENELKASLKAKPGNSFCYIEFVESSGAVLLGLLLELFGFSEFVTTIDPFNIKTGKLEGLEKKKRFVFLTGQSKNIDTALKIFNSRENRHGEYVQIIIASKLARDGINIKNVLRGYIMTPGWHEAGMYQALSRFIRADSHDYLIQESQEKIDIDIYRLASIRPEEIDNLYKNGIERASIDIKNYLNSEAKNIKNKRILRFMKQIAFDAYINYDRNTSGDFSDYTSESDYSVKFYKIWKARGLPNNDKREGLARNQGPSREEYLFNTYNLFYTKKDIRNVKNIIIDLLQKNFYMSINDVEKELNKKRINHSLYIIFQSIYELIYNNETFSNYQNTLQYHLVIKGDIIFINREKNSSNNSAISTENDIYFMSSFKPLQRKAPEGEEEEYERMVNYLINKNKQEIKDYYIRNQKYNLFKRLLEDSLEAHKNNNLTTLQKDILELFHNYWLIVDKPQGYLEAADKALTIVTQGQGRKRQEGSEAGLKKLNLDEVEERPEKDNKQYVHFYKSSEKTAFAITSILESSQRSIRILGENGFVDANSSQSFVYNYLFNKYYDEIMERYRAAPYYGTYIYRGGEEERFVADKKRNFFRIVDNSNPRNKGIVCRFMTPTSNIVKIVKSLDKEGKYKNMYGAKIRKNDLCDSLIQLFRENDLLFESF